MVFIVKLPARTPEGAGGAASAALHAPARTPTPLRGREDIGSADPAVGFAARTEHADTFAPLDAPHTPTHAASATRGSTARTPTDPAAAQGATGPLAAASAPRLRAAPASEPLAAANVDVLLAPSVLRHRYVRGVDKSSIVERPERIRAVLLGVAGAYGQARKNGDDRARGTADAGADLTDMLADLSVETPSSHGADGRASAERLRVFTSSRTLRLDQPSAAMRVVHAYAGEPAVYAVEADYGRARKNEKDAPVQGPEDEKRAVTEDPAHRAADARVSMLPATHLARMSLLAQEAPQAPPGARVRSAPDASAGASVSDGTSSDGEGDERMHACEIPEDLSQGDLYLCGPHSAGVQDTHDGGSREAICHALGVSVEAVDRVVAGAGKMPPVLCTPQLCAHSAGPGALAAPAPDAHGTAARHLPARRAFVLTRPPGHHCNGNEPSGFCWVNNVAVAAAHAHAEHGVDRVIVLDIDLHHGNGTQALAWRMNADAVPADRERATRLAAARSAARGAHSRGGPRTAARTAADAAGASWDQLVQDEALVGSRALRMYYGSIHDIESYPCEDGDSDMIRNASVCLEGAHGQWIWNVHLDEYADDAAFDALYEAKYQQILDKARRFVRDTHAHAPRTLVMISCGFDACTYEYPGMQRHGKHVPPRFYARFAQDAAALADEVADGKLVSFLEGGYSDRAICSGTLAHVGALADMPWSRDVLRAAAAQPWSAEQLTQLERMAKRVCASTGEATPTASVSRRRAPSYPAWVVCASRHFAAFQRACGVPAKPLDAPDAPATAPRGSRVLRTPPDAVSTPTRTPAGGRALRDRSVMRTRSQANLALPDATPARARTTGRTQQQHVSASGADAERGAPGAEQRRPVDVASLVPGALPVESAPGTPAAGASVAPMPAASAAPMPATGPVAPAMADSASEASLLALMAQLRVHGSTAERQ
ncbi:histone deacetylase [Malassezia sp. CBS 17886]|nr:histone deacetylase [Malassezia sp. CBS 17886]